jgi:chromodomain-helicase-DNA-binding protein 7
MLYNWHNSRSSLLADEMGLGKTLQTVTYLRQLHEEYDVAGPFLVVAPLSTLPHWRREFERWTNLNCAVYGGNAEDRAAFRNHEFSYKSKDDTKKASKGGKGGSGGGGGGGGGMMKLQVLITSYEVCSNASDGHHLRSVPWSVLVVDEAHRLKNYKSKGAKALRLFSFDRSLLLTGTPLQNNTKEFWSLLNFLDPVAFGDEEDFDTKYGLLKKKEQLDELTSETRRFMLRRMKEDVEKGVPPKEETRVSVELTLLQKRYYRALYEKNLDVLHPKESKRDKNGKLYVRGKKRRPCDGPSLMNVAMQLRKCCNHPFLLKGVRDDALAELEPPTQLEVAEAQGSVAGARLKAEVDCLVSNSGKLVFLDKLLPKLKDEGHRVLIFSQFKIMLDLLEDFLEGRGFLYERLDGDVTGTDRQVGKK